MQAYQFNDEQFIAGHWLKGTSTHTLHNLNPYTQELILKLQAASLVDVDSAYSAAERSFATWSQTLPSKRKNIILRVLDVVKIDAKKSLTGSFRSLTAHVLKPILK